MDRFSICHEITAKWEGGWSNHKADPGGATMFGVTQAVYNDYRKRRKLPQQTVRKITKTEALEIYRNQYWKPTTEAYDLVPGVDLAVYDAAVNSGVSRGVKWLKASVGSKDHSETVKRICRARLSFMQSLKIWKTFGKGWGRRVADVEARGVVMALEFMKVSKKSIEAIKKAEANKASDDAALHDKAAKTSGAAAGAGAGSPAVVDPGTFDTSTIIAIGILAALLVVAGIVFLAKKKAAQARKEAYEGLPA